MAERAVQIRINPRAPEMSVPNFLRVMRESVETGVLSEGFTAISDAAVRLGYPSVEAAVANVVGLAVIDEAIATAESSL